MGLETMLGAVAITLGMLATVDAAARERPSIAATDAETILPVVEVEASRLSFEQRVTRFVRKITRHVDDESPAVWHRRICPLVAGLKPPQGEAVLARISEVATTSGAPLAAEHCRPNLYVVATDDPSGLISAWRKRSPEMFEGAAPVAVERFTSTPRAVRAWYRVARIGADGVPLQSLDALAGQVANLRQLPDVGRLPNTRLERGTVLSLSSVFIVVDARAAPGLRLQQLADYVAMAGLLELQHVADYSNLPTILGLFEDRDESDPAPDGLTAWDYSFLRALYDTQQKYVMQRSQVVQRVVRELQP